MISRAINIMINCCTFNWNKVNTEHTYVYLYLSRCNWVVPVKGLIDFFSYFKNHWLESLNGFNYRISTLDFLQATQVNTNKTDPSF